MNKLTAGIKDEAFIRGEVPMTKEEVRVITISKLDLISTDRVIDIGAGTGSIAIECARLLKDGQVFALERKPEAISLIHQNKEHFDLHNVEIIENYAPMGLEGLSFNKVVIGGSGGKMMEIFEALSTHDVEKIVVNTITIENTYKALEAFKKYHFKNIEVVTINVAKNKSIGGVTMMMGNNPINIITGEK